MDLSQGEFTQFKNSLRGWLMTIQCHFQRFFRNRKLVECNICGWQGNRFYPHVTKSRPVPDEKCPRCHSIPRYRTLQYFLVNTLDFYKDRLVILEVGPNRSLQEVLQKSPNFDYTSVDLNAPQAMYHMDVTNLTFDDKKFDFIFCISVMQFVKNDLQGFREMYRVLKPGGRLLFASGVNTDIQKTIIYKTPSASQSFALRLYGRDVAEVMQKAGFRIDIYQPAEDIPEKLMKKHGMSNNVIYLLTR